jgi:glycosyltransferase involved in cell wall biosynthesis
MIISLFHPLVGGTEKQAQRLAKKLKERGVTISLLTREVKGCPSREEIDGITVFRKIKTIELGILWGISYILSTLFFLIRFRKGYNLIHCHHLQGFHSLASLLVKGLLNKKVIVKVAGGGESGDLYVIKERKLGRLYLQFIKRADRIISVSREITSQLRENGFSESIIQEIPNGVDTSEFIPRELPLSSGERVLIYVGRLDPLKGLDDLLKAFKKVSERYPETRLVLVGDGPERTNLIQLALELGISNAVSFEGIQEEVKTYLRRGEIFTFPSLTEGLSNVLLEAMACGLPVVATRIGGNTELIEDGLNGVLVNPRDPDELAEAIITLLANPEKSKQMGRGGRKIVEEKYSLDRIADEYLMLYQNLRAEE